MHHAKGRSELAKLAKLAHRLFTSLRFACGNDQWKGHREFIDEYHKLAMLAFEIEVVTEYQSIQPLANHKIGYSKASPDEQRKVIELLQKTFELVCSCDSKLRTLSTRKSRDTEIQEVIRRVVALLTGLERYLSRLGIQQRHDGKGRFEDVIQRHLSAALTIDFPDVTREEPTPVHAGGWARADFLIRPSGVIIETKVTRPGLNERKLGDELFSDIHRYRKHPKCNALVIFVYDGRRAIQNRVSFVNDIQSYSKASMPITMVIIP